MLDKLFPAAEFHIDLQRQATARDLLDNVEQLLKFKQNSVCLAIPGSIKQAEGFPLQNKTSTNSTR